MSGVREAQPHPCLAVGRQLSSPCFLHAREGSVIITSGEQIWVPCSPVSAADRPPWTPWVSPVPLLGVPLDQTGGKQGKKGFPWRGQLGLECWGASVPNWADGRGGPWSSRWPLVCFLAIAVVASTQAA